MNKPLDTNLPADLPENWQLDQDVTPIGTDAGLTKQHGYNYQSKQINDAHKAINELNEAFTGVQENLETLGADTTVADTDTFVTVKANNTKKRFTFLTIINAIKNKLNTVYAALVHTHGNITNDGRIGNTENQAVMTTTNGVVTAGTLPIAGGGTGAFTAAGARTNLGITPTNIGAAPATHNHNATDINAGTISAERLPTVPVSKGGTGVSNLNVNKLVLGNLTDPNLTVFLSPSGNDNNTGLEQSAPMKTIRAAIGKYGGLNRLELKLAAGTYTDTNSVIISGSLYVTIAGDTGTPSNVIITHPLVFESCDAYLYRVTIDLSAFTTGTHANVVLRRSKYDIRHCVLKGRTGEHPCIDVSIGSTGYVYDNQFQSNATNGRGADIGAGSSMAALQNTIASAFEVGFKVSGAMLISAGNTNNARTQFTMNNSAAIFNDGRLLNQAANTVATAEVI